MCDLSAYALRQAAKDVCVALGDENCELVTTGARRQIGISSCLLEDVCRRLEDTVADEVAISVIDHLEIVDVDNQDTERMLPLGVSPGFDFPRKNGVEAGPVCDSSQAISGGTSRDLAVLVLKVTSTTFDAREPT